MNFRLFIPPIISIIYNKINKPKAKETYSIGDYEIRIPVNHDLPRFQKAWRLYDRFLPVLARHINSDKVIIDVGANIGDTAVAIIQHCNNPIICIEPSDQFYSFLEGNLKSVLGDQFSRVSLIKEMVGTGEISGVLEHTRGGTAKIRLTASSDSPSVFSLDTLVENHSKVQLIKVDTDGYDFDVLKSARNIISEAEPVLFWENYMPEDFQSKGYNDLYTMLEQKGYQYLWIFDNYGNLVAGDSNFETLKSINTYLQSMDKNNCTRTLYYTDVLACTEKNFERVKEGVDDYKGNWINVYLH